MTDYERIAAVIRYLDKSFLNQPSVARLARVAGLSEAHFHRLFSRWAGTTPKDFLKFLTASHAKKLLAESRAVLNASLDAGLSGPGRLHDLLISVEAVTPGEFKTGGQGVEIKYGVHPSPFGRCLIGATKRGICHLAFVETVEIEHAIQEMRLSWPNARFRKSVTATRAAALAIFGQAATRPLRVILKGTPFQLKVWEALLRIPPGRVMTYADVAEKIGFPNSQRAVGNAVGKNSIAFVIPCHRVIRESGRFGNYRWGSERKQTILAWEGCQARTLIGE